jgi:hypothetical protein
MIRSNTVEFRRAEGRRGVRPAKVLNSMVFTARLSDMLRSLPYGCPSDQSTNELSMEAAWRLKDYAGQDKMTHWDDGDSRLTIYATSPIKWSLKAKIASACVQVSTCKVPYWRDSACPLQLDRALL